MVRTVSNGPRMTGPTRAVLETLLADTSVARYGLDIGTLAGLPSGTVHPILARLEVAGWLESEWEDVDPVSAGRPRRRYYRLTAAGAGESRVALAAAAERRARITGRAAAGSRPALGGTS